MFKGPGSGLGFFATEVTTLPGEFMVPLLLELLGGVWQPAPIRWGKLHLVDVNGNPKGHAQLLGLIVPLFLGVRIESQPPHA